MKLRVILERCAAHEGRARRSHRAQPENEVDAMIARNVPRRSWTHHLTDAPLRVRTQASILYLHILHSANVLYTVLYIVRGIGAFKSTQKKR